MLTMLMSSNGDKYKERIMSFNKISNSWKEAAVSTRQLFLQFRTTMILKTFGLCVVARAQAARLATLEPIVLDSTN